MKPSTREEAASGFLDPTGEAKGSVRGSKKPCIVLFDRRSLFREAFAHVLATDAREFSVLPRSSVDELKDSIPANAGVVILNVGNALITDDWVNREICAISTQMPDTPIIVLCDAEDVDQVTKALNGGVRGYIPTSYSPRIAIGAIRLVYVGGVFVPATALLQAGDGIRHDEALGHDASKSGRMNCLVPTEDNIQVKDFAGLTARQREVLKILRTGQPNKNIAYSLNLKEATVKVHIRQLMKKLKATNRTQLARLANQHIQLNDQL